jgi:carboxypeptidase Taq
MEPQLTELKSRLAEVQDLRNVNAVLGWDQSTYMPRGGAAARGRQSALLGSLAHQKFTDPAIGRLLDALRPYEESLPYDQDDASLIRVTRREYDRNIKVPADFVARLYNHMSDGYVAWEQARPENDFAKVTPYLEKTLDLSRAFAEHFAPYEHIADPLIEEADYGMKTSTVSALFAELRGELVPLVDQITSQPPAKDDCLRRFYPETLQWQFNLEVARQIGYDFERGRLDKSAHPFTTQFGLGDVRITTRVNERDLSYALFSTIHECRHAMYEQGIDRGGCLAAGRGHVAGVHESQSRLWENLVGRSREFLGVLLSEAAGRPSGNSSAT